MDWENLRKKIKCLKSIRNISIIVEQEVNTNEFILTSERKAIRILDKILRLNLRKFLLKSIFSKNIPISVRKIDKYKKIEVISNNYTIFFFRSPLLSAYFLP